MNALETYLRRATRGVWGTKRTELIAELRGSIEARIWMLECQGYASERALEVALTELGQARVIAAGLIGVHTMPKIFRSTLALGLFAALSVTLINSSRAQIEVSKGSFVVTTGTERFLVTGSFDAYFLNFESIKKNLEDAGIVVDATPQKSLDAAYGTAVLPTLRFRLLGSDREMSLQATESFMNTALRATAISVLTSQSAASSDTVDASGTITSSGKPSIEEKAVSLSSFARQLLKRSGLPVRVLGWRNPTIEVGTTKLQIGSEKSSASPREIFVDTAGRTVQSGFPQVNGWFLFSGDQHHVLRVNDSPGTVYAVVTSAPSTATMQSIDAARVADDGVLYFDTPYKVLEFVKTPLDLVRDRANIGKPGYGSSSRPAKALLIRITPDLKTSFVMPARVRSGAIK